VEGDEPGDESGDEEVVDGAGELPDGAASRGKSAPRAADAP
jgi:hypothetical protein